MKEVQLLFVVETNQAAKTDDAYYLWILHNYFQRYISSKGLSGVKFYINFVYMDGKTNYNSKYATTQITNYKSEFVLGPTEVIYCFDIDNYGNKNRQFINTVKQYCASNNYYISFAHPEIENVFNITGSDSKVEKVKRFRKKMPKKTSISQNKFFCSNNNKMPKGYTCFGTVVQNVLNKFY